MTGLLQPNDEERPPSHGFGRLPARDRGGHGPAMSDTPSETDRLARLEIRLTEQEATIDDLNATITAQWTAIDRLTRQVARLQEQVEDTAFRAASGGPEPPPPHY